MCVTRKEKNEVIMYINFFNFDENHIRELYKTCLYYLFLLNYI